MSDFEPRLQHPPEDRRSAAGRDRDHERTAVDDRGHDEVGEFWPVGDVDQRAGALGRRPRALDQAFVLAGDEAERAACEVFRLGVARGMAEIWLVAKLQEFVAELRGENCGAGPSADQQLRPPRGHDAAADHHDGSVAHVENDRQITHNKCPKTATTEHFRAPGRPRFGRRRPSAGAALDAIRQSGPVRQALSRGALVLKDAGRFRRVRRTDGRKSAASLFLNRAAAGRGRVGIVRGILGPCSVCYSPPLRRLSLGRTVSRRRLGIRLAALVGSEAPTAARSAALYH